jgi:hypothetical protein
LIGVVVLYGDNGIARNNKTSNSLQSANGELFNLSFPGTCPYITSINATQGM